MILMARGLPKLPQPEPEVAYSTHDFYAVCMTETRPAFFRLLSLVQAAYL